MALRRVATYVESRKDEFIPATFETVTYDGKFFGVPKQTDAAFLYYRTDQVEEVPATWQGVYEEAAKTDGIAYQGAAYEGLTCDYLELAFAAGGKVLSEDGKKSEFNSQENIDALAVHGRRHQERRRAEGRHDVHGGARPPRLRGRRVTFQRNWPYAYALGHRTRRSRASSRSRRSRSGRAAARPASSAATTSSSPPTRRTRPAP